MKDLRMSLELKELQAVAPGLLLDKTDDNFRDYLVFMFNKITISPDIVLKKLFQNVTDGEERYINIIVRANIDRVAPVHIHDDTTMLQQMMFHVYSTT